MDTTKKNIKMCKKAEEIQKKSYFYDVTKSKMDKLLKRGFYKKIVGQITNEIYINGHGDYFYFDHKELIWIPRQSQLLEMIIKFTGSLGIEGILHNLIDFINENKLEEESFEMILLRYLMYIKYGKTWDSEEVWVV